MFNKTFEAFIFYVDQHLNYFQVVTKLIKKIVFKYNI